MGSNLADSWLFFFYFPLQIRFILAKNVHKSTVSFFLPPTTFTPEITETPTPTVIAYNVNKWRQERHAERGPQPAYSQSYEDCVYIDAPGLMEAWICYITTLLLQHWCLAQLVMLLQLCRRHCHGIDLTVDRTTTALVILCNCSTTSLTCVHFDDIVLLLALMMMVSRCFHRCHENTCWAPCRFFVTAFRH